MLSGHFESNFSNDRHNTPRGSFINIRSLSPYSIFNIHTIYILILMLTNQDVLIVNRQAHVYVFQAYKSFSQ